VVKKQKHKILYCKKWEILNVVKNMPIRILKNIRGRGHDNENY